MTRHIFASFHSPNYWRLCSVWDTAASLSVRTTEVLHLELRCQVQEGCMVRNRSYPGNKEPFRCGPVPAVSPPPFQTHTHTHTHTPITVQLRAHLCCNPNLRGHNINIRSPPCWSFCRAPLCTEVVKGAISGKSVKDGRTD